MPAFNFNTIVMKKPYVIGLSALLLSSLMSLPAHAAGDQTTSTDSNSPTSTAPTATPPAPAQDGLGGLAALLQMDAADLRSALASGQKLEAIAANHGVSQSQLNEYFAAQKYTILSSAGRRSVNGHVVKIKTKSKKNILKKNPPKSHRVVPKKPIRLARPSR